MKITSFSTIGKSEKEASVYKFITMESYKNTTNANVIGVIC